MPEFLKDKKILILGGVALVLIFALVLFMMFNRKEQAPAPPNVPVTLTWWKNFYGQEVYGDIIRDFQKLPGNNNVKIDVVKKNWDDDYYSDLISDFARDAGPDIYTLRNDDLPAYKVFATPLSNIRDLRTGQLIPDTQLLGRYRNDFVDLAVRDTTDLDKIYGVTSFLDNLQLYYNKDILAQSGIALPPTTWDELQRQLPLLNKRAINSPNFTQSAISLGTGYTAEKADPTRDFNVARFQDVLPALIFQNGGQLFDYQTNQAIFGQNRNRNDLQIGRITDNNFTINFDNDNPTFLGLNFYKSFADPNNSRYSWNTASNNNVDLFLQGKLAYIIHYSYFQDTIRQRQNRLSYGVSELPQLDPNIKKTYGFFFMDVLNKKMEDDAKASPNDLTKRRKLEKAREFLHFLSTREAQQKFSARTGLPSARRDVIDEQLKGDRNLRIFAAGSLYADNYYKPDVKRVEQIWGDMMYRIQYQNEDPNKSLTQAIREYSILVRNGPQLRR